MECSVRSLQRLTHDRSAQCFNRTFLGDRVGDQREGDLAEFGTVELAPVEMSGLSHL